MKVLILSVSCVNPDADHPSHCLLSLDAATCDLLSHVIEAGAGAFIATKPVRAAGGSLHCLEVMLPDGVCEWCDIDGALNSTGIPWKYAGTTCHFNVFPPDNLRPWTAEQADALIGAATVAGFGVTDEVCFKFCGSKYFDTRKMQKTKGFRAFART